MTNAEINHSHRTRSDRLESRSAAHSENLRLEERVSILRERLEARIDLRAVGHLHNIVREARGHVKDWNPEHVNLSTAARYARETSRMRAAGLTPEDARCRATFEFQRASVVHEARREIKHSLSEIDRARRSGDVSKAANALNRAQESLSTLRRYPPTSGDRLSDLQRHSAFRGPSNASPDRSNGKRTSIHEMQDGWQDPVQAEVREQDRPAVSVMSLTGARPAEAKGIKVRQDSDAIHFDIKGAKVDSERGVQFRTLTIEKSELARTQAGRDLQTWLGGRSVRTVTYDGSLPAFRERVNRAFDRAGLEHGSGYSFRHQVARDLKDDDHTNVDVAERLGHRSKHSSKKYG